MIRAEIAKVIKNELKKQMADKELPAFSVSTPENPIYGDYSSNIALLLSKILRKSPMEMATELAQALNQNSKLFSKVEAVAPGFINFWISPVVLQKEFKEILIKKNKYGGGAKKKEKFQVEFISANPTGPLTLANGRGGFLGDALSHVLELAGFFVEREYYVNDTGNQIITLGKSILSAAGLMAEEDSFYKGAYIKEWAKKNRPAVLKLKNDPLKVGQLAAKDFLKAIKSAVEKKAGISFDRYTSEDQDLHKKSLIAKALALYRSQKLAYEKDGAVWLKTTEFGDDKDRVLVTSDGYPTYFLADSGHYLETKKRGFTVKINILGPDHYGYVSRIQAAAKILGVKKSIAIVTQAVRLVKKGREIKMSKRKGEFITFEELVDKVGVNPARFFFLEKSPDTHIDFDLDLAKERSVKNPVYYIQYAHARMASILRKAPPAKKNFDFGFLNSAEEIILIKKLIQFPEIVADTAEDYQVHRLPRYAHELARIFHNFYEKQRVITDDEILTAARLKLVLASQIVLKNLLKLMGIDAPDKM